MSDEQSYVELDEYAQKLADQYEDAAAAERLCKEQREKARDQLIALLEAAGVTVGTVNGEPRVKLSVSNPNRLDTVALKRDQPALFDTYSTTSAPVKTIRVTKQ